MITTTGWVVYAVVILLECSAFASLIGGLAVVMSHEMRDDTTPAHDPAQPQSANRNQADSGPKDQSNQDGMSIIRPLPEEERNRFIGDWRTLQPQITSDPEDAIGEADRLISTIMQTKGYPIRDIARSATGISAEHPEVVSHYFEAHRVAQRAAHGHATTEEERHALIRYHELFDQLVGDAAPDATSAEGIAQTG